MLQGTGSDVGKSLLVAGLARALTRRGLAVLPFKPQNMSNNAAVTADGGEIGRAQALQARACKVAPRVAMNPVLLKPQSETGAQLVVEGRVVGNASARDYQAMKRDLLPLVLAAFERLAGEADIVLVEGAGSAGGSQSAAGRHRQYGLCRGGARAGDPGRRHRPRRRHRRARRHPRAARRPRSARCCAAMSSTSSAAIVRLFAGATRHDRGAHGTCPVSASCRGSPLPATCRRRTPWRSMPGRRRAGGRARSGSPCRACRTSPTSTISIRCGRSRASRSIS